MRRTKIDELPQLFNVLRGDMSIVGPRPEMARYVELFRDDYAEVLRCRPGMTDLASIKYLNEEAVLAGDPEHEYLTTVLPAKIAMAKDYCRRSSTALDIKIILRTLARLLRR